MTGLSLDSRKIIWVHCLRVKFWGLKRWTLPSEEHPWWHWSFPVNINESNAMASLLWIAKPNNMEPNEKIKKLKTNTLNIVGVVDAEKINNEECKVASSQQLKWITRRRRKLVAILIIVNLTTIVLKFVSWCQNLQEGDLWVLTCVNKFTWPGCHRCYLARYELSPVSFDLCYFSGSW